MQIIIKLTNVFSKAFAESTFHKDKWTLSLRIIVLSILLFYGNQIFAQKYFFDKYSVEEGLANSKVYCILQDKNHFLWLGTPSGVSFFNGSVFRNFSSEQGLAENGVWSIYQDTHGYIWFGHFDGGISRWNGQSFESIPGNVIFSKDVHSFCETDKGELWITTDGAGAALVKNPQAPLKNIKYECYKGKRLSDRVFGCVLLHDHRNYFITDGGLKVFNPVKNNFDDFYIEGMPRFFQITTMLEDHQNNIWMGTYHGGLYCYDSLSRKCKIYDIRDGLSSNFVTCLMEDRNGKIWVGTEGGITTIQDNKLRTYNQKNGLPADKVYCLTIDAENNILIGTADRGAAIYKGEILVYDNADILPNPEVWSILEDSRKRIWLGTNAGITILDNKPNAKHKITVLGEGLGKPSQIRFLEEDRKKNVWIGTDDNGVFQYNPKSNTFSGNVSIYSELPSDSKKVTAMGLDTFGNLWIGALDRLLKYEIDKDQITGYSQYDGLTGSNITSIYIDPHTNIKYIGALGRGLTIFKDSLPSDAKRYPLLGNTTPNCMTVDKTGKLWIGTNGQGLLLFQGGEIQRRFQEKDGMLSDLINFVETDTNDDVYVGTNRGLNVIEAKSNLIKTYTKRNGFTGIEAKNNAVLKDSKNNWWFGTVNGAICFGNLQDRGDQAEPLTHLTRFTVNQTNRPLKQNTHLSYKENAISFGYSSICLSNPDAVSFQVMLTGADKSWQPVTSQTTVSYQALPPGKYVFKVKAKNFKGRWNTRPIAFSFSIAPPFYTSWWFISLSIFLALLVIFIYIKIREENLLREKRILEDKVVERTAEVVNMNKELAMKNKDIVDSILYASRIQNALLPPDIPFNNTFIFYIPKDIVSGDFFWFATNGNKEWIAVVDCTGHGVPGAFMSIIGHNLLNKIVNEMGISKPSDILNMLNDEVSWTLHQYHYDNQIHDGMDICLICYDKKDHIISYSGAFNPLWIIRQDNLLETRANRYSIGMAPGIVKEFINHEIPLETGDTAYLFTDGFADQFGGPFNKKLKVSAFKELILYLQAYDMDEQKIQLENFLKSWRGNNTQVDDILIIGRKFIF